MPGRDDDPTRTADGNLRSPADPALDTTLLSPGLAATSGVAAVEMLVPGTRVGRYVLGDQLGAGGMGVVYRASDPELDRELAIKIVLPQASSPRAQQRLLSEAKAMARLRHPAVVPVFDVGETEHGVYVVMPLIAGGTLHDWLRRTAHPWREVVDKFLVAGRGLAAAHAACLVHRDFKPRNVLIGDKGDVMVADFGLATESLGTPDPGPAGTSRLASSVAGTPAYMAPEQAQGIAVDARADQYSFCISFWEGLTGERPHDARTRTRGALPSLTSSRAVPQIPTAAKSAPTWLLATIARGFSALPSRRWPSMTVMLDHIEKRLRRPRQAALALFGTTTAGAVAWALSTAGASIPPPCPDPIGRLAGIWDPAVRAEVGRAFAAVPLPFAKETFERIAPRLDAYASRWRTGQLAACRATHVEHTQSAQLLERRGGCLDRRLTALGSLTRALTTANKDTVRVALDAVDDLAPLDGCDDAEALQSAVPLPADPLTRTEIDAVHRALDAVDGLRLAGQRADQLAEAEHAVARARKTGHSPLLARALHSLAIAQRDGAKDTETTWRELAKVAAEARDDRLTATAWIALVSDLAVFTGRTDETRTLEPVAEAAVLRAGSPPDLRGELLMTVAVRAGNANEPDVALERLREAIPLLAERHRLRAETLVAHYLLMKGDLQAARTLSERVLVDVARTWGPRHPRVAEQMQLLGQVFTRLGAARSAEAMLRGALALQEVGLGADHIEVGVTASALGNALMRQGRNTDARPVLDRAISILELGGDQVGLGLALSARGTVRSSLGESIEVIRRDHERALSVLADAIGRETRDYGVIEGNFALSLAAAGRCADAAGLITHALEVVPAREATLTVPARRAHAICAARAGARRQAIMELDKILELCRREPCAPGEMDEAQAARNELYQDH